MFIVFTLVQSGEFNFARWIIRALTMVDSTSKSISALMLLVLASTIL